MPKSLFVFIWRVSGRKQIFLCLLTIVVSMLTTVPLELQRRIVDDAIHNGTINYLLLLSAIYLLVLLLQGGLKYMLNVFRGRMVEDVAKLLRQLIFDGTQKPESAHTNHKGAVVSMVAAETEDLAGFVGDSISFPLLQAGTAFSALGYLVWVEPRIAIFAAILYMPQLLVVPLGQRRINRWGNIHARLLRKMGDTIVGSDLDRKGRPKFQRRFRRLVQGAFRTRLGIYRVKFFLTFFGNFLDALAPLIVLSVGGWLVIKGEVEVSTLVVFITGFQKVADPWDQLLTFYRTASNASVKYHLIADALPGMKIPKQPWLRATIERR
ncbi:ABC transporter transmembrane domain-containing protein [Dongia sp.]|uniref:ABC transporter transmembrane domain-containing protein n=1 Tax=Dongia sp. TaxID=1977262 RepID=UPI0035AF9CBA